MTRLEDRVVPTVFADGFEAPTLNSFWSTRADSGTIALSSFRPHTGNQSVQLNSIQTGQNKYLYLTHDFASPTYGTASIYVYDTGADVSSSNYLSFFLQTATESRGITGYDYDLGPGQPGSVYYVGDGSIPSGVDRTLAWHKFAISTTPNSTEYRIDNQLVYTQNVGFAFTQVLFGMSGPSWRPAFESSFDDFELNTSGPSVSQVVVNDGTIQRSRVERLTVQFDQVVSFAGPPASAFSLQRLVGGVPVATINLMADTVQSGSHTEVTLNFLSDTTFGSLNDGHYRLTVVASQVQGGGSNMSADYVSTFHRFFGDANGDARVDIADFGQLSASYLRQAGDPGYLAYLDYNADGRIDIADFGQFSIRYFTNLP